MVPRIGGDILPSSRYGYGGTFAPYYGGTRTVNRLPLTGGCYGSSSADLYGYRSSGCGNRHEYSGCGGSGRSLSAGCGFSYRSGRGCRYRGLDDAANGVWDGGRQLRSGWSRTRSFSAGCGIRSSAFNFGCTSGRRRSSVYAARRVRMPTHGRGNHGKSHNLLYPYLYEDGGDYYLDDSYWPRFRYLGAYHETPDYNGSVARYAALRISPRSKVPSQRGRYMIDDEWEDDDGWSDYQDDLESLGYLDLDIEPALRGFESYIDDTTLQSRW